MVQQIIGQIHTELRNMITKNQDLFYSNGHYSNCSIQALPTKDKVKGVTYFVLHVVFQFQVRNRQQQIYVWWISALNQISAQCGIDTMML